MPWKIKDLSDLPSDTECEEMLHQFLSDWPENLPGRKVAEAAFRGGWHSYGRRTADKIKWTRW